jgi:hypothetical protein
VSASRSSVLCNDRGVTEKVRVVCARCKARENARNTRYGFSDQEASQAHVEEEAP